METTLFVHQVQAVTLGPIRKLETTGGYSREIVMEGGGGRFTLTIFGDSVSALMTPDEIDQERGRVAHPAYVPRLDEALRHPAEFVEGMTEVPLNR